MPCCLSCANSIREYFSSSYDWQHVLVVFYCVGRIWLVEDVLTNESCCQHFPDIAARCTNVVHCKQSTDSAGRSGIVCCWCSESSLYLGIDSCRSGQLQSTERLALLWRVALMICYLYGRKLNISPLWNYAAFYFVNVATKQSHLLRLCALVLCASAFLSSLYDVCYE